METRMKMNDLYPFDYMMGHTDGLFLFLASYDSTLANPILTGIVDYNNASSLDFDYIGGFSNDKYLSPLVRKSIKYCCENNDISYEQFLDGTLSDSDRHHLISSLFDAVNGDTKLIVTIHQRFASKWKHIWDALNTTYNPLENYSMLEERTPDITKERTLDTTDERTPNITKTTNGTGTTSTDSQTGIFGFNSASSNPSETIDGNQTDTITDRTETETGTDTSTQSGTITDTETGTETLERSGNIGVTTSQQMLQSEFEVRKYDFYKEIYKDIDSILCLKIY